MNFTINITSREKLFYIITCRPHTVDIHVIETIMVT